MCKSRFNGTKLNRLDKSMATLSKEATAMKLPMTSNNFISAAIYERLTPFPYTYFVAITIAYMDFCGK